MDHFGAVCNSTAAPKRLSANPIPTVQEQKEVETSDHTNPVVHVFVPQVSYQILATRLKVKKRENEILVRNSRSHQADCSLVLDSAQPIPARATGAALRTQAGLDSNSSSAT